MRQKSNKIKSVLPSEFVNIIRDKSLTKEELISKVLKLCNKLSYDEAKICADELNKYLIGKLYLSTKESARLIKNEQTKNIDDIGFTNVTNIVDNEGNSVEIKIQNGVEIDSDILMFIVDTSKKMFNMYPTGVGLTEIRLHETFSPDDYEIANRMSLETFSSSATTNYKNGIINLWDINNFEKDPLILYHEYAHLIAEDLASYDVELGEDYKKAVEMDNNYINEYTRNDLSEDFAEAYALCFLDREKFYNLYPNRYNVLIGRVSCLDENKRI